MDARQVCAADSELELARARCVALQDHLAASPDLPRHPALRSLLRLVDAELRFLSSLHPAPATPLSSNLPHLAALHLVLTHPAVRSPSRLSPLPGVDFACAFRGRPAWVLVSASNPARLAWAPPGGHRAAPATRPEKLLLVFSRGVGVDIARGLAEGFEAVETDLLEEFIGDSEEEDGDGWVAVSFNPSEELRNFRAFEIDVVEGAGEVLLPPDAAVAGGTADEEPLGFEGAFGAFMRKMWRESRELVNLDTTALVAIVSGISNGGVGKLMATPEAETRARFKCNYKFVMDQVAWKCLLYSLGASLSSPSSKCC